MNMMKNFSDRKARFMTRVAIVGFWLMIIAIFLFLPRFVHMIRPTRSINIMTFPRVIDAQILTQFEHETGIKVYLSYYENNDELLVKMRQTKGEGYDLIIPSDYAVDTLRKEGLLQQLDTRALPFFDRIHPKLLHHYYDPEAEYSIPYFWGLYGLGIDRTCCHNRPVSHSWDAIFDEHAVFYKIGMINNSREAVLLASWYLFGSIEQLDATKLAQVKDLLIKQKKWVQAYTDLAPDYLLLSGSSPVVVGLSSDILQAHRAESMLEFVLPQEGTFMVIDAMAIPRTSTKAVLVYEFLKYVYRPEILQYHADRFSLFSPIKDGVLTHHTQQAFSWLETVSVIEFFKNVLPEAILQEIWFTLKAS